jgi:hypothetical protein
VVVIASSDSDFAPLVQRLREKGCVVRGIGQKGKTGDETQDVYDDYTVLEHRKAEPAARAPRKTPARKTAARKAAPSPAPEPAAEAPARKTPARKRAPARKVAEAGAAPEAASESPPPPAKRARKTAARKTAGRKTAAAPEIAAPSPDVPAALADPRVDQVLAVLPELAAGQALALNVAVQRLREARLLGRNAPSTKFFAALAERFELLPVGNPTRVLLRS